MKKDYYSTLDVKNVTDSKTFWKTVKPFESDKILTTEGITLVIYGEVVPTEQDTALVLNTFFPNIVTNLRDPIIIVRYRNYPSILTIGEVHNKSRKFYFQFYKHEKIYIAGNTET